MECLCPDEWDSCYSRAVEVQACHDQGSCQALPTKYLELHKNLVLSMVTSDAPVLWLLWYTGVSLGISWAVLGFFNRQIKVSFGLYPPFLSKYSSHCLESYPPQWLQLSYCCAHHGTLEVGAKSLQTVKVHIKVDTLQGWPVIFIFHGLIQN